MIPVFILTYIGIDYFNSWFDPKNYSSDLKFFIVDNGQQTIPDELKDLVIHQTKENIGCSGGYNLIMDIGFNHLGFEKIVIAQDDGPFTDAEIKKVFSCSDFSKVTIDHRQLPFDTTGALVPFNPILGLFGTGFSMSIMSIDKNNFDRVGRFDENFLCGRCEDDDYLHRCKLAGVIVYTYNENHINKVSALPSDYVFSFYGNNVSYLTSKWGRLNYTYNENHINKVSALPSDYVFSFYGNNVSYLTSKWGRLNYRRPFNDPALSPFDDMPFTDAFKKMYGDVTEYPSVTEFKRYKRLQNGR